MNLNKLLTLLSDGRYHSGSDLGEAMNLSRTSIWKAIPNLQELGVPVEVIKGKGYRIPSGLDLLNKNQILSLIPSNISNQVSLEILLNCTSTNDYISSFPIDADCRTYQACLAENQTKGRGRRGKFWISPFGKNISCSLGFQLGGGVEVLSGLSLVVGVAVAKTLETLGVKGVGLKWPNDVYVGGKKIAGILLELSGEATTSWKIVCGVGLNVHMSNDDNVSIDQEWCSLIESVQIERSVLAAKLICELISAFELFKKRNFQVFMDDWTRLDILSGETVIVTPGGLEGCVIGVNLQGALIVRNSSGEHLVNAGEVSVRRL